MKTLDSLGLGLIMSAALVIDSAAQSTVKVNAPASSETKTVEPGEQVTNIVQFSAPKTKKSRKQKGTFYATSLHWSAENHELYFKGKVKVDVGENHFVSDGSVTFLDKVYMLIIDGSSVKLDSTVKLSRQQYHLTQLSNKEAMEKYGEEGANGAVEINVIEE